MIRRIVDYAPYISLPGVLNWEAYRQHPFLKSFCWIYQSWITKKGLEDRWGMRIVDDIVRSKDRYKLLKELGVM